MPEFPRSYLDKFQQDIDKLAGVSSNAKMVDDISRAVGAFGQRELEIARALSQVAEVERTRKALGLDRMQAMRKGLIQHETEQMQRMLRLG